MPKTASLANEKSYGVELSTEDLENRDSKEDLKVALSRGEYQSKADPTTDDEEGEVSYVLLVQPDLKDEDGFEDEDESDEEEEEEEEETTDKYITEDAVKIEIHESGIKTAVFRCKLCKTYTTTKKHLLQRHLASKHSNKRPFKCKVCDKKFKKLCALQNHENIHTGKKPFKCTYCDNGYATSGEMSRHIRYKHTKEKPHKCSECGYSSVESAKLQRHMRTHIGGIQLRCNYCTYTTPNKVRLNRHLRLHKGDRPYECEICHLSFATISTLKSHRYIHSTDKPVYKCEFCPSTCGRMADLRIHIKKLHSAQEPLTCQICENIFPDKYSLKTHVKTHDGEKNFKCSECPYMACSKRHLVSHLYIHSGLKPFACSHCNQTFRQKQLLKRHFNAYHNPDYVPPEPKEKPHECPECFKTFLHKGNLLRHLDLHDPDPEAVQQSYEIKMAVKMAKKKKKQAAAADAAAATITTHVVTDSQMHQLDPENSTTVTVQTEDGHEYVVLEVIDVDQNSIVIQGED